MGAMVIIALVQIATTPKFFVAKSTFLSDNAAKTEVSGGFVDLLGISTSGSASGSMRDPDFFPTIMNSQAFQLALMKETFYFGTLGKEMSLEEFASQYDDRSLVKKIMAPILSIPGKVISLIEKDPPKPVLQEVDEDISNSNTDAVDTVSEEFQNKTLVSPIVNLTGNQLNAMAGLKSRIVVSASGKLVTITVRMPDALVAAQVNQLASEKLFDFVVKGETEKERRDLFYVERRVGIAKENFEQSQDLLAQFQDQNQGIISASARSQEQRLRSEHDILLGIYRKLATELEEKKIALEEKTPVFTVFDPVYVPVRPESSSSIKTIILNTFLGFFLAGTWVVFLILRALIIEKGEED